MVEGVRECLVSDMFYLCTFRVIPIEITSKVKNTEERTGVIKLEVISEKVVNRSLAGR